MGGHGSACIFVNARDSIRTKSRGAIVLLLLSHVPLPTQYSILTLLNNNSNVPLELIYSYHYAL